MTPEQEVNKIIADIEKKNIREAYLINLRNEVSEKIDELYKVSSELGVEVVVELPQEMEVISLNSQFIGFSNRKRVISSPCRIELVKREVI